MKGEMTGLDARREELTALLADIPEDVPDILPSASTICEKRSQKLRGLVDLKLAELQDYGYLILKTLARAVPVHDRLVEVRQHAWKTESQRGSLHPSACVQPRLE